VNIDTNEIRDYLNRAPRKWEYRDGRMLNNTHARLKWLSEIAIGSIDQRINRRAGISDPWLPWCNPGFKAMCRNQRKLLKKHRA